MKRIPPDAATQIARRLRSNPTDAEKVMWNLLRQGFPDTRFRRQVPVRQYIVDFASHRAKLVIEVDGGQHNDALDGDRDAVILADGYRILRFWNHEVLQNPDGVHDRIVAWLGGITPTLGQRHVTLANSPIKGEG